jgi:hypothetical protein
MKKLTAIRQAAHGQECTLRVSQYGGCASTETTVLAHAPCRDKGTGFKSPDWWAAFACFRCHHLIDTQQFLTTIEVDQAWLRGIYETNKILREMGLIK